MVSLVDPRLAAGLSRARGLVRDRPHSPDSCSAAWVAGQPPAWGSAATATFWVALEQPGPWGHDAFAASRLDPVIGGGIAARAGAAGGRALLLRTPGRASLRRPGPAPRRVLIATGMPVGRPQLWTGSVTDPRDVLDLPWQELAAGHPERAARALDLRQGTESVLLICTNAQRDVCCAKLGLPLAATLAAEYPQRVFECSHTGGHRFAPTGVLLPTGATLGRLTSQLAAAALHAPLTRLDHNLVDAQNLRGLAHLEPVLQAADAYARATHGVHDLAIDTRATLVPGHPRTTATTRVVSVRLAQHGAGEPEQLLLAVTETTDGVDRPVSCGRAPAPSSFFDVAELT
ncbi:hypothetical protein KILIM_082_00110 [Kineosphaera limosa NBRC 100340]|uniref:Sucrase ferredoxin n=1 Tax=Kineosphaera limosa NBRC 100340 TaxID=1184609 RepID=K6XG64_9MICO|nr:hypothetical protein KILIM_082_00110 [Kineosphaera limosa NBRC 100340]